MLANLRPLSRQDLPSLLRIERAVYEFPWDKGEFVDCLRQPDCSGVAAEVSGELVGYMVYQLQRRQLHLLNLAVDPKYRRTGVGSQLLAELQEVFTASGASQVCAEVLETNLSAQLFFRRMGLRATATLVGAYTETSADAYVMTASRGWRIPAEDPMLVTTTADVG